MLNFGPLEQDMQAFLKTGGAGRAGLKQTWGRAENPEQAPQTRAGQGREPREGPKNLVSRFALFQNSAVPQYRSCFLFLMPHVAKTT